MTVRTQPAQRTQAVQSSQPRVNLGSAILASLKAIKDNPTGRTVGEQATALAGVFREAGVKTNNWEHYLLYNFKKTVTGEDPNALSYMKTNLSWAGEVMSRGDINRAISMATQANRAVANKSGIDVKTAQDWMGKQLSSDRPMTEKLATSVASTLRDAGFSDDAKKTGLALVRLRRQIVEPLRYGTRGLEALQKDVGDLKALTLKAAKQGVVNRGTQSELLRLVDLYQKDSRFQVKTPEQVRAGHAAGRSASRRRRELERDGAIPRAAGRHEIPARYARLAQRLDVGLGRWRQELGRRRHLAHPGVREGDRDRAPRRREALRRQQPGRPAARPERSAVG
ncbi:MAG: hypothetical protein Q8S33_35230 [Myxococcales bacterium]|nr:hypothetical protein [Myxococcales bacterium]